MGGSGIYASYVTAFRFITRGREVIEQGCAQYPSTLFKIPMVNTWQIIVTNPEHIGEIRRAKDEDLSLVEAQNDVSPADSNVSIEIYLFSNALLDIRSGIHCWMGKRHSERLPCQGVATNANHELCF